jgi:ABC-type nitrate/sulfonate/bicarbonate transport system permease component
VGGVLRTFATVAVLVLVWEIVARLFFPLYILPPPSIVAQTLVSLTLDGTLWQNLRVSLVRVIAGYLVAAGLAIPLGIAAGWWRSIDQTLGSVLELLRPLPSLALIPLAIVWLGFGEVSKIAVIAYASFFSIYLNTQAGVRNVDPLHVKVMLIYGNGTRDVITKVVMYSILPYVFTGLRYSAAVALILLVAVELVGSQSGLGFFLVQAQSFLRTPDMFAAIVVFGVLGFCANLLVAGLERRVIKWRPETGR